MSENHFEDPTRVLTQAQLQALSHKAYELELGEKSEGAPVIAEVTVDKLIAELGLYRELSDDEVKFRLRGSYHPSEKLTDLFFTQVRQIAAINPRAVAEVENWQRRGFTTTGANIASFGMALVAEAFEIQYPGILQGVAQLDPVDVKTSLSLDVLDAGNRHLLVTRVTKATFLPSYQIHLRDVLQGVCAYFGDPVVLRDGASGMYRIIDKNWASLDYLRAQRDE